MQTACKAGLHFHDNATSAGRLGLYFQHAVTLLGQVFKQL